MKSPSSFAACLCQPLNAYRLGRRGSGSLLRIRHHCTAPVFVLGPVDVEWSLVESRVTDVHYYFKFATRHADIKELQSDLGVPQLEFLRHVNSIWLTLLPSVERVLKSYGAPTAFFSKAGQPRSSSSVRHGHLSSAFLRKHCEQSYFSFKTQLRYLTGLKHCSKARALSCMSSMMRCWLSRSKSLEDSYAKSHLQVPLDRN